MTLEAVPAELRTTAKWDFSGLRAMYQRSLWDAACRWDLPNPEHR
jgi:hypothetical protein